MTTNPPPTIAPEDLISVKTAATLLGVDSNTIKNWIKAGQLQGWLLNGRMWRVERDAVIALVRPAAPGVPSGGEA
ncbi:helix-turn-helix domain-containing protein [Nocardia sp. XZ_19_385]|uniref:helix-turn-helix domain-containing protein n=1 Tax=Nocardia sp. XZ_19_385 TaxID=2769488 RepID=UPI00188DDA78|nr:helix-turn-helix domain-containing protein [Nocardia sp. XZ_19_385]